jgi:hypothetical protein
MYEGVYSVMVKAGVAIETPEARMYFKHGERVLDEYCMDGRNKVSTDQTRGRHIC